MDLAEIVKKINKYHIPIIISVIILLLYLSVIMTAPPFADNLEEFDGFQVLLPRDVEYKELTHGIRITGGPSEYASEITITDDGSDLYNDVYNQLDSEGYYPTVLDFNKTHYDVYMNIGSTVSSDDSYDYYYYYDFIIPKKDYDDTTYELKKDNTEMGIVRGSDYDFTEYLMDSIKFGDEYGS